MRRKTLYLIRHAKAEDHGLNKKDIERALIKKGIDRATLIASRLKEHMASTGEQPLVISSTARRAAETARIFSDILDIPQEEIIWEPTIYEAHYLQLMKRINDIPSRYTSVLLFGHNPGLSDLVAYVTNQQAQLKTSHVACLLLEEDLDFSMLSANTADLQYIITES